MKAISIGYNAFSKRGINMKKITILWLVFSMAFLHSIYAISTSQLDYIIDAPVENLKKLSEAKKIETFLDNRSCDELTCFFEKYSKKIGNRVAVFESITDYGSYDFTIVDYDHKTLYINTYGKVKKIKFKKEIYYPENLNNSVYFNSTGIKGGAMFILTILNNDAQCFCSYYGIEYTGENLEVSDDYKSLTNFIISLSQH